MGSRRASMAAILGAAGLLSGGLFSQPAHAEKPSAGAEKPSPRADAPGGVPDAPKAPAKAPAKAPPARPPAGVTVRLDILDGIPVGPVDPAQAKAARAKAKSRPAHYVFVDEQSSWVPGATPVIEAPPGGLQCVPYARMVSGIGLRGDAWTWWEKAVGTYARGNYPEPGAVLAFPGIERMPLGHVAVVTHVLGSRKILIDHANWPTATEQHGAISREILAVDVSADNDWTEVRVQFGNGGPLGGAYPTHGFIYGWSEAGVQIARPAFSLAYALWSPLAPSWRLFNPIAYSWALPAGSRPKAYAALRALAGGGTVRPATSTGTSAGAFTSTGKNLKSTPALVLGTPAGTGLNGGALTRPIGVGRALDGVLGAGPRLPIDRFVSQ